MKPSATILLVALGLAGIAVASTVASFAVTPSDARRLWLSDILIGVASGMLTGLVVYFFVSMLHDRAVRQVSADAARGARVKELVALARLGRSHALESISLLREMGAVSDGSLRNASFAGADLSEISFDGADLREADLSGCDLRRSSFVGATVDDARFDAADLREAILEFRSVKGARFDRARLEG